MEFSVTKKIVTKKDISSKGKVIKFLQYTQTVTDYDKWMETWLASVLNEKFAEMPTISKEI